MIKYSNRGCEMPIENRRYTYKTFSSIVHFGIVTLKLFRKYSLQADKISLDYFLLRFDIV